MSEAEFQKRIAIIKDRFGLKLAFYLRDTTEHLPKLVGNSPAAVEATTTAYRRFHDICGIGPTVGFEETGRAARPIDAMLAGACRTDRGLTEDEMIFLEEGLKNVRAAVLADGGSMPELEAEPG
ncbi:hypothetical protein IZ6_30940 [Terrihabitans soli]|uniref:Hpt domain-containing protein n=1 Tax=Terrihabitans soli TaxID=708113 RepID=A0A6S6QTD5_9HYPH|nr:hypothetical protein [Terrihabitans soli]BCJ92359.1 hypothetical protein IZ6_30940 [Terrihabitans soli]